MEALTPRVETRVTGFGPTVAKDRPAGLSRRAVALLVDAGIVWILIRIGALLSEPLAPWAHLERAFFYAYLLVVPAAYFVLLHGTDGRTVGKRMVGVRVTEVSGRDLDYLRALLRQAAWSLSAVVLLGAGHLIAAFRPDKRALHDLLAGTRVVRRR